jgi:hypothetical protein
LSEKQTPQPVEKTEDRMEIMEPKEARIRLHTQEVRGSSPCAPTIFNNLQTFPRFARANPCKSKKCPRLAGCYVMLCLGRSDAFVGRNISHVPRSEPKA